MPTKHVFLSFVEEDMTLVRLFRGQARNENNGLAFDDYSVKIPYMSANAVYIRNKIKDKIQACSVLICLIGKDTHKSPWVDWEIKTAHEMGKKVIGVRLRGGYNDSLPAALVKIKATVCRWSILSIVRLIG